MLKMRSTGEQRGLRKPKLENPAKTKSALARTKGLKTGIIAPTAATIEKPGKQTKKSKSTSIQISSLRDDSIGVDALSVRQERADKYDKMSKTLGGHAAKLSAVDARREAELRPQMVGCLKDYSNDEAKLGRFLSEYRVVYKNGRQWTKIAIEIGKLLDRSARTLYRMADAYEASLSPDAQPELDIVLPEIKLTKREAAEVAARHAIRVYLENVTNSEKLVLLAAILSEEAHQVWGSREQILLTLLPKASKYTIDGRLKLQNSRSEVKVA
jgi:hypothetical protein